MIMKIKTIIYSELLHRSHCPRSHTTINFSNLDTKISEINILECIFGVVCNEYINGML